MEGPPENDFCSVCHCVFRVPCQANCSHWFCGDCIMLVWHHGSALQPCKCPLCRRLITLLVPAESSLQLRHDPIASEILRKVETYNRTFGGRSDGLIQRMQDLPFFLRRLVRELMDPERSLPFIIRARVYISSLKLNSVGSVHTQSDMTGHVDVLFKLIGNLFEPVTGPTEPSLMVLSAIYVLSPVDFIPEAINPIIGYLDDLIIVLICFLHVSALYRSVLYSRHGGS